MTRLASICCAALLLVLPSTARAQDAQPGAPAHISVVDGAAVLQREGSADAAPSSMPLLVGDRLRTDNGRVEVLFGDGTALHLDSGTTVDLQSDEVIRLTSGRVRLSVPTHAGRVAYRIDTPSGWIQIDQPGDYRVATRTDGRTEDVELVALRGGATLLNDDGQTAVRAGERTFARLGSAPSYPYVFNSAALDAFDQWSEARRAERRGVSTQYLPDTVQSYSSTFDDNGDWRYDGVYGYVWYPRVKVGWRPYYYGRWASLPAYGWTWIGHDPWAWPTHHYGRWGVSAGVWFWIPGRVWGPAWVSWAYAPGYVSWCPLGFNNRPVVSFVNVNIYGGHYNAWHAWTVVPHQRFGHGWVNNNVVVATSIDVRTRSAFVVRDSSPAYRGVAVPRNAAPFYGPGVARGVNASIGAAVPRGGNVQPGAAPGMRTVAPGAASRGTAEEAAAAFRSRRPASSEPVGPGYPAAARAPRASSTLANPPRAQESAVPRQPATAYRPQDVPVYRGGVLQRDDSVSGDDRSGTATRRYEVPGYRRSDVPVASPAQRGVPSSGAGTVRSRSPQVDDRPGVAGPTSSYDRPAMGGAAPPPVRVYRGAPTPLDNTPQRMEPRPGPGSADAPRAQPRSMPGYAPSEPRTPGPDRGAGGAAGAPRGTAVPRSVGPPPQGGSGSGGGAPAARRGGG